MTLSIDGRNGTITVPDSVLAGIAARAAEQVEGVRVRRRRIDIDHRLVRLTVSARRGDPLTELGEQMQERVATALQQMCKLPVTVDVTVGELE